MFIYYFFQLYSLDFVVCYIYLQADAYFPLLSHKNKIQISYLIYIIGSFLFVVNLRTKRTMHRGHA